MKAFAHVDARSLDEAVVALCTPGARIIAGGTDILGAMKDNILAAHPATLVNVKTIPGLEYIEERGVFEDRCVDADRRYAAERVRSAYAALAQAADWWAHRKYGRWEPSGAICVNFLAAGTSEWPTIASTA